MSITRSKVTHHDGSDDDHRHGDHDDDNHHSCVMTIIMDSHGYVHVDTHESPSKWRILNFKLTTEDNKYRGYFCFQIEKATS